MKFAACCLPILLSIAATSALFGVLESSVNMIEGLRLLFAPGATTVVFTPFLLLFILLGLAAFVVTPMFVASAGATLAGLVLRWRGISISPASLRLLVPGAVIFHIAFVLVATHYDAWFLLGRPRQRPQIPDYALACIAGANAALTAFVATFILRRVVMGRRPPQIHASKVA